MLKFTKNFMQFAASLKPVHLTITNCHWFCTFAQMHKRIYSVKNILSNLNIDSLNEMQQAALEITGRHNEVILLSATGSGKTLAFLLPVVREIDPDAKE